MKLQQIFEVRYRADPLAWHGHLPQNPELEQFVNANKKLFEKLFIEMRLNFHFFYGMVIENMDDQPENYNEKDRDPREIFEYWWDQYPIPGSGGDDLKAHLEKHFEEPSLSNMFDDVIQAMGDHIAQTARQIVEN